ncbi:MAG: NnrS family protein [Hydrogenophaga sp.]|jgi:uncharacterized protein involved in response to NO|nr:NnrS family protein [Hydrogenophaga sp.]
MPSSRPLRPIVPWRTEPVIAGRTPQVPAANGGLWQWRRLATAPHRLTFFAGGVLLALASAWWLAVLMARHHGLGVTWAVAPPATHALVMTLSFFPMFMAGFLMTAGPRWLGLPAVPGRSLLLQVAAFCGGWIIAAAGFHLHPLLAGAGVALAAGAWGRLVWRFVRMVRASLAPDRLHAQATALACALGAAAMAAAAFSLAVGDVALLRAANAMALWGFVAPVFAIVSHRMLPFFTHSALPEAQPWRAQGVLAAMLLALGVSALGAAAATLDGPLNALWRAALLLVQAPAALFLLRLGLRWGLVKSHRIGLLAMLFAGFVWLAVALALSATAQAVALLGGQASGFELAATHALSVGFLGATLLAMISRVVAGHSGRPLVADRVAWLICIAVHCAALLRVMAALRPERPESLNVLLSAATLWALAGAAWACRYGNWMGRPRRDGRPG